VAITVASVQDRVPVRPMLWNLARACIRVWLTWADAGYADRLVAWPRVTIRLEIVRKPDAHAFEVLPHWSASSR
jgi:hypothetical protein